MVKFSKEKSAKQFSFIVLHSFPVLLMFLVKIFLPRSQPAAYMPLRFVHIQHLTGLRRQMRVNIEKAFRYILMYRALADPELFRSLPHCGIVVDNIISDLYCPLLDILFQKKPLRTLFYIV